MITIRRAKLEDLDWLIGQLRLFSAFYDSKKPLFGDEKYVREGLTTMIDKHLVLVAVHRADHLDSRCGCTEGHPVGFIAGFLIPHVFNPAITCLSETFWWVQEEHRRSRAGYMLLKEFIEFGKKNVDWILCTIEEHSPINPSALMNRGFKLKEQNFVMEVV